MSCDLKILMHRLKDLFSKFALCKPSIRQCIAAFKFSIHQKYFLYIFYNFCIEEILTDKNCALN